MSPSMTAHVNNMEWLARKSIPCKINNLLLSHDFGSPLALSKTTVKVVWRFVRVTLWGIQQIRGDYWIAGIVGRGVNAIVCVSKVCIL